MPATVPAAPPAREVGEPKPVIPPRSDAAFLNNRASVYPAMLFRFKVDDAALQALRWWCYVPARRGDEPIPYWYMHSIDFAFDP